MSPLTYQPAEPATTAQPLEPASPGVAEPAAETPAPPATIPAAAPGHGATLVRSPGASLRR